MMEFQPQQSLQDVLNHIGALGVTPPIVTSQPIPVPEVQNSAPNFANFLQIPAPMIFNPFLNMNNMLNQEIIKQFLQMNACSSSPTTVLPQQEPSAQYSSTGKIRRDTVSSTVSDEGLQYDANGDIIVPSNDKEGWCRNKKYIEKTENGFMCTVCRKVYGRYNSVSYHVTIYHRNPPIRCNLQNCQFTTREARYIHFHKYYRHGVPLPQSIDQGSRKCPHCRHVSKSPAMLEKHIRRHQLKDDDLSNNSMRNRTVTISEEPMEEELEEEMEIPVETKPRSCTM
ncbi:unnamed protein product [Caenorhabditis angaria]|uniref:C2H2-type domain-containing protein n=1 Tax=Caenorhabditis angaria TaxID=860376 RepID=A0A9P1IG16_9PELO|nr:unnamed protein product [Caenorhabditis angaria]